MPLSYSGDPSTTLNGTRYRATGSRQGEEILVDASHEAIENFGEKRVKEKASEKYDAGNVSLDKISVRIADFA